MTVQAITAALSIAGVSPSEKLLLIVLANYADEQMKCWPSHSRLAANTCMSERNILRLFTALEAKGLLSRAARYKNRVRTSDVVTLKIGGDTTSPHGDTVSKKVGTPRPRGGDTVSGKPSMNLKEEPSSAREARAAEEAASRAEVGRGMRELAESLARDKQMRATLKPRSAA